MSLISYFRESREELRKVAWPTWLETRQLTLIVIGMSIVVAIFLGIFDYIFTYGLGKVVAF